MLGPRCLPSLIGIQTPNSVFPAVDSDFILRSAFSAHQLLSSVKSSLNMCSSGLAQGLREIYVDCGDMSLPLPMTPSLTLFLPSISSYLVAVNSIL